MPENTNKPRDIFEVLMRRNAELEKRVQKLESRQKTRAPDFDLQANIGQPVQGQLAVKSSDNRFYHYSGGEWRSSDIYVDDRILDTDTDLVVFNGFPSGATILEVTWNCWLPSDGDYPSIMNLAFNGPPGFIEEYYRWRLSGSIELNEDEIAADNGGGGVAFFLDYERATWGRIRFPDHDRDITPNQGQSWVGEGAFGDGYAPDVWQIAGYVDSSVDPLTEITFWAETIGTDISQNFAAGSRFTLTAY